MTSDKPEAVLVDIDGTIAHMGKGQPGRRGPYEWHRVGEDDPCRPILNLVRLLAAKYRIVFVSGRDEICREQTEAWLDEHHSYLAPLFMRPHKDNRPDNDIKLEIYQQHIEPHYDVVYVLDDRDQVVRMWRSLGLTVLQVADGNF